MNNNKWNLDKQDADLIYGLLLDIPWQISGLKFCKQSLQLAEKTKGLLHHTKYKRIIEYIQRRISVLEENNKTCTEPPT